eukprot:scaffold2024_cov149-Pinguiococcus_pyrenoidosus.AAC.1
MRSRTLHGAVTGAEAVERSLRRLEQVDHFELSGCKAQTVQRAGVRDGVCRNRGHRGAVETSRERQREHVGSATRAIVQLRRRRRSQSREDRRAHLWQSSPLHRALCARAGRTSAAELYITRWGWGR